MVPTPNAHAMVTAMMRPGLPLSTVAVATSSGGEAFPLRLLKHRRLHQLLHLRGVIAPGTSVVSVTSSLEEGLSPRALTTILRISPPGGVSLSGDTPASSPLSSFVHGGHHGFFKGGGVFRWDACGAGTGSRWWWVRSLPYARPILLLELEQLPEDTSRRTSNSSGWLRGRQVAANSRLGRKQRNGAPY